MKWHQTSGGPKKNSEIFLRATLMYTVYIIYVEYISVPAYKVYLLGRGTIQYSTVQYSTVQYSTAHSTVW